MELRGRGGRRESASRSQSKFRVSFSAEPTIRKMNPIPSLDSGMRFPLELPLGKHVPLYGSIPGRSFRLMCHPETTSQSEAGFRDGLSAWAAIGKACPGLRCQGVFFTPAPCTEFDSPRVGMTFARGIVGCHPIGIASIYGRGIARRIRVFASQIRTGFGRLPASSPARYKRFAFA